MPRTKSILMLLFGGWLALLSACAQLLSLAGLFLVDAKHLGTAQGWVRYFLGMKRDEGPFHLQFLLVNGRNALRDV